MLQKSAVGRYSAVVDLRLILADGQICPLSQIGPDFVILESPRTLPPGPATIVTVLDGNERRTEVTLLESAAPCDIVRTRPV
jgi:hypothetical protein